MTGTDHIESRIENGVGEIILNRPKALNALTLDMLEEISRCLDAFAKDKSVGIVLVTSTSDRAFCAGGDIKTVALHAKAMQEGTDDGTLCQKLFQTEYQLNSKIKHFQKPYISLIDGICMGGGMGISVHGSHRIVTERARFAMPEVNIGFFPDVGSGFSLNRLTGGTGMWLAMTGSHITGDDMLKCGLATHYIDVAGLEPLLENIRSADWRRSDATSIANAILANYCEQETDIESDLDAHSNVINRLFHADTVEDIFNNLEQEHSDWARDMRQKMAKACPVSVVLAHAHLKASRDKKFDEVMQAEFQLSQFFVEHPDFYEGVRAMLIDKDNTPKWSSRYDSLEDDLYDLIMERYADRDLGL